MKMKKNSKKAVSPVITTILLVMMAVILAVIILLWAQNFKGEQVEKFDGPIENLCEDIIVSASVSGNEISLINSGNVPVYMISIRVSGNSEDKEVNLLQGGTAVITSTMPLAGKTVELVPVLLGTIKDSNELQSYFCLDNRISIE